MRIDERQLERAARLLDGEAVAADDTERRIAQEVQRYEALVGEALGVEMPSSALRHARRRVKGELARPRDRVLRISGFGAAVAAAAAVAIMAVSLLRPGTTPEPPTEVHEQPRIVLNVLTETGDEQIDALAGEVSRLEEGVAVWRAPYPVELELDDLQEEVEVFWINEVVEGIIEG